MILLMFLFSFSGYASSFAEYEKYYQAQLNKVKNLEVIKKYKNGVIFSCQGENVEEICGTMGCTMYETFIQEDLDCKKEDICFSTTILKGAKDHFAGEYRGKPYAIQCEQYVCQQTPSHVRCEDVRID